MDNPSMRRADRLFQIVQIIRPLGIFFWGAVATLGAWCELREDFRNFRVDRVESLEVLNQTYAGEPGRTLQEYYRQMAERYGGDDYG